MINKFNFPKSNYVNSPDHTPLMFVGRVVSIEDKNDAGRIIVNIKGVDDKKNDDNQIMEAFPLLPKMINVFPEIGESVFVFTQFFKETTHRYWVGPIISQPQMLNGDQHFVSAQSALVEGSNIALDVAPSSLPEAKGVYPNKKFVSIQGRNNTDIIHKDGELLLRAGKFVKNNNLIFNKDTTGFIQIKSNVQLNPENEQTNVAKYGSVTNIVGNMVNILSHDGSPNFNLSDNEYQITDKEMRKIISDAHPLVYGDTLIELIKVMRNFELNHIHEYINLGPNDNQPEYLELSKFPLDKIISKNIRIN